MTERGKKRFLIWLPVLVCFACVLAASAFWLQEYRQSAFTHISKLCEILIENNPDSESEALSAVKEYYTLSEQEIGGNTFLERYGYRSEELCKELGRSFFPFSCLIFLFTSGCFFFSARYADRRNRMRIAELTAYLEQVNAGADKTVLQLKEDDFSHLQDEMYKTVTELYQTRDLAVQAKRNFADNLVNIAHQLKTPITAADLSLQLMKPDAYTKQVKRQLERLNGLEESLLTLSKLDAGTLLLERREVDLYTVLNLAAENLSDLCAAKQVRVFIPDKGCVGITGDLEWTMEAFINLMKNCMEHSPKGGTIHCDYSRNPLYAEVLLWDEGEGFCQEDIPHLFERFYRGKRAAQNGIGIGLSLAGSIIELQNGAITARNLQNGGACFEIRIYSH